MGRRRTDKAVEQLRAIAEEVREEVAWTLVDLKTLPTPTAILQVLKEAQRARQASEDLLARIIADPLDEDRDRRIAVLKESLAF